MDFARHEASYLSYFKTEEHLWPILSANRGPSSQHDCLLLFSGGKDSTYVLSRLVQQGERVLTFTFDNGFTSPVTLENIQRTCEALGVENVMMTLDTIDQVYRDSLKRNATVCSGCFRALTYMSTKLALDRGIKTMGPAPWRRKNLSESGAHGRLGLSIGQALG